MLTDHKALTCETTTPLLCSPALDQLNNDVAIGRIKNAKISDKHYRILFDNSDGSDDVYSDGPWLYRIDLSDGAVMAEAVRLLRTHTNIKRLSLCYQSSSGLVRAFNALKQLPNITIISTADSTFSEAASEALVRLVDNLPSLTELSLRDSRLKQFPLELALRRDLKLKELYLFGNPDVTFPPRSVAEQTYDGQAALRYFSDLRAGCECARLVNALVLGHGAAGKSTLIQRGLLQKRSLLQGISCFLFFG